MKNETLFLFQVYLSQLISTKTCFFHKHLQTCFFRTHIFLMYIFNLTLFFFCIELRIKQNKTTKTKMSTKRLNNVSVNTMNPVNEEDEPLPDPSPPSHNNNNNNPQTDILDSTPINDDSALNDDDDDPSAFNQASEHLKLRTNIDTVFKSLPPCQQLVNLDTDNRRLEALEQLLIDRLINTPDTPQSPQPPTDLPQAFNRPSSAAFSSNLTNSYLSQNPQSPEVLQSTAQLVLAPIDRTKLDLNSLQLTSECLRLFSRERLLQQVDSKSSQSSLNSSFRSDYTAAMTTSSQLTLHASAKQVMIFFRLCKVNTSDIFSQKCNIKIDFMTCHKNSQSSTFKLF